MSREDSSTCSSHYQERRFFPALLTSLGRCTFP